MTAMAELGGTFVFFSKKPFLVNIGVRLSGVLGFISAKFWSSSQYCFALSVNSSIVFLYYHY